MGDDSEGKSDTRTVNKNSVQLFNQEDVGSRIANTADDFLLTVGMYIWEYC